MKENTPPQDRERLVALLGLASQRPAAAVACPTDERLAAFIDGRLEGADREALLVHLDACPDCRHTWLEVASQLDETAPAPEPEGVWSRLLHRLDRLTGTWTYTVPAAAVATLAALLVFWPASPDLGEQIDQSYAAVVAEPPGPALQILPPPWESTVLGAFDVTLSDPARAFDAGWWTGRSALSGSAEPLPAFLAQPWADSEWAVYYQLGRWTVLLWSLTQAGQGNPDFARQQALLEAFQGALAQRPATEEEATRAAAALRRIEPLLHAWQAGEPVRGALARRLVITMQQLGS